MEGIGGLDATGVLSRATVAALGSAYDQLGYINSMVPGGEVFVSVTEDGGVIVVSCGPVSRVALVIDPEGCVLQEHCCSMVDG